MYYIYNIDIIILKMNKNILGKINCMSALLGNIMQKQLIKLLQTKPNSI